VTDSGSGLDGGWSFGPDSAETLGVAHAREAERRAGPPRPHLGTWSFPLGGRAILLAVVLVFLAAWLLTALNAG
jgi:hypothetical protein